MKHFKTKGHTFEISFAGVLLCGPPGTGKTLLAKAVATTAGVPLLYCSGSDFVEMYVGRGAARVRRTFEKVNKLPPSTLLNRCSILARH